MAASGGRAHQEVESSSTMDDPDLYCLPCYRTDGEKEEATGFCNDCHEHLCKSCYKAHHRNKYTAFHALLDQHHMPKFLTTAHSRPATSNVPCIQHANKPIEFFCSDHEAVLCSVCSTLNHRQCKIDYIPVYAASYLDSEHGRSKLTRIQAILRGCDRVKKSTQGQLEDAERNTLQAIEDLELHRDKIVNDINKELGVLKDKAVKFRTLRRSKADEMLKQCDTIRTDVHGLESTVKEIRSTNSNKDELFIKMLQSHINLDNYEIKIEELENTKLTTKIKFSPNVELSDIAIGGNLLGQMNVVESLSDNTKATKIRELNVKAGVDGEICGISGIELLSDNTLALADCNNKSIKKVNATSGEILHEQKLPSRPWDLTLLPNNKLAVSLADKSYIQFVSTEKGFAFGDSFPCKPHPRGIKYHKEQLVVSFNNPNNPSNKVEILSLTGNVIRSFSPGLKTPSFLTVSKDSHILISDLNNAGVLRLDWTGRECGTYTDTDLKIPKGITVAEDGKFFVCSRATNTVQLVSENCKKITTLMTEKHGVRKPFGCCYDEKRRLLYVSFDTTTDFDNNIAVYQLA